MLALTENGKIIHIKDAQKGINYRCDKCGGILKVKDGKIRTKHFYHLKNNCGSKGESLIHKYWKEYFCDIKEFDGYKIIHSKAEVSLLKGSYIPDVLLKTDQNKYIIIEINYKNSKDNSYFEKFKRLSKKLERVYEVKVDLDNILDIRKLYDTEEMKKIEINRKKAFEELEKKRKYIMDIYFKNGGLIYGRMDHFPTVYFSLHKDIKSKFEYFYDDFTWKSTRYQIPTYQRYKKFKIYLQERLAEMTIKSTVFYINIYDYENLKFHKEGYGNFLGELYSKDEKLQGNISVFLASEK